MAVQHIIPGTLTAPSTLPKFERQIAGFDRKNLEALYLFEDGATNSPVASPTDSSGKGRNASLVAGSVAPVKTAAGVFKDASAGSFLYQVPGFGLGQAFTIVMVGKSNLVPGSANQYPIVWRPSTDINGSSLANDQVGGEAYTLDMTGADLPAGSLDVGWFHSSGYMAVSNPGPGNQRIGLKIAGGIRRDWAAFAFTYSPNVDRYAGVAGDQAFDITAGVPSAASKAKSGLHTFGLGRWGAIANMPGDLALFAIYSGSKTVAEMQDLVARAKARVGLRGVAAY